MTNRDLLFLESFIAQCNLNNSTKEKQAVIQSFYDQDCSQILCYWYMITITNII